MAIAPVLKTGVRKDIQVRILYPPFRFRTALNAILGRCVQREEVTSAARAA